MQLTAADRRRRKKAAKQVRYSRWVQHWWLVSLTLDWLQTVEKLSAAANLWRGCPLPQVPQCN